MQTDGGANAERREERPEQKNVAAERRDTSPSATENIPEESDSDDSFGPTLPGQESRSGERKKGPSIPNVHDLELKRGTVTL